MFGALVALVRPPGNVCAREHGGVLARTVVMQPRRALAGFTNDTRPAWRQRLVRAAGEVALLEAEVAQHGLGDHDVLRFASVGRAGQRELVVEETGGRVISKVGAEGVHTVAVFDQGIGFAIKVEDGATRAQYPAVLRLLGYLGALPPRMSPRLAEYARTRIRNTRGEVVGELFPASA